MYAAGTSAKPEKKRERTALICRSAAMDHLLDHLSDQGKDRRHSWRFGGGPTSHTPAHDVPAMAASFRT